MSSTPTPASEGSGCGCMVAIAIVVLIAVLWWLGLIQAAYNGFMLGSKGQAMSLKELPQHTRLIRVGKQHVPYKDGYWYQVELPSHELRSVYSENPLPDYFMVVDGIVIEQPPPLVQ